ncbi:hypothetical protein [Longispora urticae]
MPLWYRTRVAPAALALAVVLLGWIAVLIATGSSEDVLYLRPGTESTGSAVLDAGTEVGEAFVVVGQWFVDPWVCYDLVEVAVLLLLAYWARRRLPIARLAAFAIAGLLIGDACWDLAETGAEGGWPLLVAVAMAALLELPIVGVCLYLAGSGPRPRLAGYGRRQGSAIME